VNQERRPQNFAAETVVDQRGGDSEKSQKTEIIPGQKKGVKLRKKKKAGGGRNGTGQTAGGGKGVVACLEEKVGGTGSERVGREKVARGSLGRGGQPGGPVQKGLNNRGQGPLRNWHDLQ